MRPHSGKPGLENVGRFALRFQVKKGTDSPMVIGIAVSPVDENTAQHLGVQWWWVCLGVLPVCEGAV